MARFSENVRSITRKDNNGSEKSDSSVRDISTLEGFLALFEKYIAFINKNIHEIFNRVGITLDQEVKNPFPLAYAEQDGAYIIASDVGKLQINRIASVDPNDVIGDGFMINIRIRNFIRGEIEFIINCLLVYDNEDHTYNLVEDEEWPSLEQVS